MKIRGRAIVYGDKIDTDVIIPAKYLVYTDPAVLGQHAMEPLDPEFPKKAKGAILVLDVPLAWARRESRRRLR
jgi:3-isopropylmalate/(R)-2-methylmalate dehydratase small subunit